MKRRSDGTFLLHIYEALNDIVSYTSDGQAEFFAEKMRQDAVERKFEIIGEARQESVPELFGKVSEC